MLTIIRLAAVGAVGILAWVGCGTSPVPAARPSSGPTPNQAAAAGTLTVTFLVKDMGQRLNLL